MSQRSNEISENQILMEQFIHSWAQFTVDHPLITLGEWLKTFGIMTGLAMKMGNLAEEDLEVALRQMNDVTRGTFARAEDHIEMATLQ